jgi:hypothetical protein
LFTCCTFGKCTLSLCFCVTVVAHRWAIIDRTVVVASSPVADALYLGYLIMKNELLEFELSMLVNV